MNVEGIEAELSRQSDMLRQIGEKYLDARKRYDRAVKLSHGPSPALDRMYDDAVWFKEQEQIIRSEIRKLKIDLEYAKQPPFSFYFMEAADSLIDSDDLFDQICDKAEEMIKAKKIAENVRQESTNGKN